MKDLEANIQYKSDMKDHFNIGSLAISTISLNHPGGGLGYKFTEEGKSFVFSQTTNWGTTTREAWRIRPMNISVEMPTLLP